MNFPGWSSNFSLPKLKVIGRPIMNCCEQLVLFSGVDSYVQIHEHVQLKNHWNDTAYVLE